MDVLWKRNPFMIANIMTYWFRKSEGRQALKSIMSNMMTSCLPLLASRWKTNRDRFNGGAASLDAEGNNFALFHFTRIIKTRRLDLSITNYVIHPRNCFSTARKHVSLAKSFCRIIRQISWHNTANERAYISKISFLRSPLSHWFFVCDLLFVDDEEKGKEEKWGKYTFQTTMNMYQK